MFRCLLVLTLGCTATVGANVPVAPVPADPHELVAGGAVLASTPAARAAALALFERAKQNSDLHMPETPPFFLKATFNVEGSASGTGAGELTETWMSGRSWRWTANLGDYSQIRLGSNGTLADAQPVSIVPMRVQTLRSAIFWPVQQASNVTLRTAAVEWNGRSVTCILGSGSVDPSIQSRQWVEEEYCVDNASGLLQIHSPAPGSFIVYGYSKDMQFHGRVVPDHITAYIAGVAVIDAQVDISDAGKVDAGLLAPTEEMLRSTAVVLNAGHRFATNTTGPATASAVLPVIVHITIDANGTVADAEVSAAADPALSKSAVDLVRHMGFSEGRIQRETYVNVRFMPPGSGAMLNEN